MNDTEPLLWSESNTSEDSGIKVAKQVAAKKIAA